MTNVIDINKGRDYMRVVKRACWARNLMLRKDGEAYATLRRVFRRNTIAARDLRVEMYVDVAVLDTSQFVSNGWPSRSRFRQGYLSDFQG
jgi:hypothetical protein